MKIKRSATAYWAGTGKEGQGSLSTQSTILDKTRYGYQSRFEDGPGTNPEELLGAAHAGCMTMKLAFALQGAGFEAQAIEATSTIILEDGSINNIEVTIKAKAEGLTNEKFQELAELVKATCLVSQLFRANITLTEAVLVK